jgi:hypothetical protein
MKKQLFKLLFPKEYREWSIFKSIISQEALKRTYKGGICNMLGPESLAWDKLKDPSTKKEFID